MTDKSKRTKNCNWCRHKYQVHGLDYCTLTPEWMLFDCMAPSSHFCGSHSWNSKANAEIREEIFSDEFDK